MTTKLKTGKDVSFCIDSNYHKGTNTTLKSRRQLVLEDRGGELLKTTTVAYSKSTRENHIDVRGKCLGEANTISCGDGGSNQSSCNYVVELTDDTEEWKSIFGYEGFYEVSSLGKVRSLDRSYTNVRGDRRIHKGRHLSLSPHSSGYVQVDLNKHGVIEKSVKVHRLVAEAYLPNPENKLEVNHKNGIKHDNRVVNLEWNSRNENMNHAKENELMIPSKGVDNGNSKLTEAQVLEICDLLDNSKLLQREIAEKFNVCRMAINQINTGTVWNHLTNRSKRAKGDGGSNMSTQNFVAEKSSSVVSTNLRIRKLTPVETERLQGYPDGWTSLGKKEDGTVYNMSNTQRFKQCGNGVSAPVASTILSKLIQEPVDVQSLFTGIAGTELALPKNFNVVGHCEFDKYASDVLRYHYPTIKNWGDVTKFVDQEVPAFDLLTFGFPCQSFSIAGLRQGFEDEKGRGQMIYHVFDIIKKHKPKYLLGENVKGLLNHDGGKTFIEILKGLSALGYDIDFELVNSKHFNLAQNRERVFIFGKLK